MSSYTILVVGSLVLGQSGDDWYNDFKPFADIETRLQVIADDRPDLCTLVDIGDSIEGRDICFCNGHTFRAH